MGKQLGDKQRNEDIGVKLIRQSQGAEHSSKTSALSGGAEDKHCVRLLDLRIKGEPDVERKIRRTNEGDKMHEVLHE